ncbi:hypothetical protein, partial [Staphylococcus aureus]
KTMSLSAAQAVTPALYYVGFFGNGTTMPQLYYSNVLNPQVGVSSPLFANPRFVVDLTNTGLTTAFHSPATLTTA